MVMEQFSLAGRVAVVTGGGQGLGRVFSLALAEAGADVAVADLNPTTGAETAELVRAMGRRAVSVATDVRSRASVFAMAEAVVAELGSIDIMVNNAGITKWCAAEEVSEEDWREVMSVNVDGVFYGCQAAARQMIARGQGGASSTWPRCRASLSTPRNSRPLITPPKPPSCT